MIGFNKWFRYPWSNGRYTQNERAILEDDYRDMFRMYHLMSLLLEALQDKLLEIKRNGSIYHIPICNIKDIYLTTDDCRVEFVENGHYYETDISTSKMVVRTAESLEVKRPEFKIV